MDPVEHKTEALIDMVSRNPALWNKSHPRYRDNQYRENIWKTIGVELQLETGISWDNEHDMGGTSMVGWQNYGLRAACCPLNISKFCLSHE